MSKKKNGKITCFVENKYLRDSSFLMGKGVEILISKAIKNKCSPRKFIAENFLVVLLPKTHEQWVFAGFFKIGAAKNKLPPKSPPPCP